MPLTFPRGESLLRLTTVSPANFGHSGGTAPVDRPLALDTWRGVPYIPASALKGVLAGRSGNVTRADDTLNTARTAVFGAPVEETPAQDELRPVGGGRAAKLVFGDGELVSFPLLLRSGARARVYAAEPLWRLVRWGLLPAPPGLRPVERDDAFTGNLAGTELPVELPQARFGVDAASFSALAPPPEEGERWLVAAPKALRQLWRSAVERRTLTALGSDKRVEPRSLRSVELVPPGTAFVSSITNRGREQCELEAAGVLQLGAWEGLGCGYLELSVGKAVDRGGEARPDPDSPQPAPQAPERPDEVMTRCHRALRQLQDSPDAHQARAAIFGLPMQIRLRGLGGTLAFLLTKAAGEERKEAGGGDGVGVYRWSLRVLLEAGNDAPFRELAGRVREIAGGAEAPPADLELTLLWLRRYAELLLPAERTNDA